VVEVQTTDTGKTLTTDTAGEDVYDCGQLPPTPLGYTQLNHARGYHDVALTADGQLLGSDNNNLKWADDGGTAGVLIPGLGTIQSMDYLPDGNLVIASDDLRAIVHMDVATDTLSILATDIQAYGLVVGPDGYIYTANYHVIHRIDATTGEKQVWQDGGSIQPRVINFSPKYDAMYMGTRFGNGNIYRIPLDGNLDPAGPPEVFARDVGTGDYHDSMGVDICGNLYVADYSTTKLYRIGPQGFVQTYVDFPFFQYGHGVKWGSGIGGWRDDAIYMPQPYNSNRVVEIVVGVPSRYFTGTVIMP
jgi:hypothetical protein